MLAERTVTQGAPWLKDLSVLLEGLGREATLEFDLRFTDRDGGTFRVPADLLLGVADPTFTIWTITAAPRA